MLCTDYIWGFIFGSVFFSAKTLLLFWLNDCCVTSLSRVMLVIGFLSSCSQQNFVVWMKLLQLLLLTEPVFPVWTIWSSLVWSGLSLTVGTKYGCHGFSRRFRKWRFRIRRRQKKAQTESTSSLFLFWTLRSVFAEMLSVVEYLIFSVAVRTSRGEVIAVGATIHEKVTVAWLYIVVRLLSYT